MPNRRIDSRRIKIHRNYTVEEAAKTLGVHKNTVRSWIRQGLPTLDERRPTLLLGKDIRAFLDAKKATRKRRLLPGQFYCLKCRAPRAPYAGVADYIASSATGGNLVGLCPQCEKIMNRRTSLTKLEEAKGALDVTFKTPSAAYRREDPPPSELCLQIGSNADGEI
ncbi:helix-turn-helix domain-containing protein [Methylocella silvestris]|uniref:DNA-binding protein n=1 Tax=Methylocella silvestris TaxID=199596 RepID=A0A2J7TFS6_METSI|nr:DNA-binding protein [Methylocella silvestris]